VDELYLKKLIDKAEGLIHRKIRFLVLSDEELEKLKDTLKIEEAIPLWGEKDSDE
jgi:hypothetical protein